MAETMANAGRILSIGDDDSLRISRDLLLRTEGYEVESVTSIKALKALPEGRFDAAVISQSVTTSRAAQVAEILRRRHPGIRILRIREPQIENDQSGDLDCETLSGPNAFLVAVRELCDPNRTAVNHRTACTTASKAAR